MKYLGLKILIAVFVISVIQPFVPNEIIPTAKAAINKQINYQGKLTNSSYVAVADGTYNMEFKLYDAISGGTTLWTETRTGGDKVQVTNGLFSVMLGSVTSLASVDFNQTVYLGVNIGGTGSPSWDGEMTPRKTIGSVPAAIVANGVQGDGVVNVTNSSATALTVAKSGSNYALQVDTSTASAVTGLKVTSAAVAGGVALTAISSGTNENLTLDAKGSGSVSIGASSTGDILFGGGSGSTGCTVTNSTGAFACTAGLSGTTFTGTSYAKAPYIYGGDMSTTYGGYSGGVMGGTTTHAVLDFVDNGSRIGEFYTTSSSFNFFTDTGKTLNFYTNNDLGTAAIAVDTSGRIGIRNNTPSALLTLGTAGATAGTLSMAGSTSGTITIQPQATAGTYNFNLPTTAGSSGYVLTSAGGGASPMTWTDPSTLGGTPKISALTAANSTNSINNADYAQTWSWNTLSSNSALTLSSSSTTAASNTQTLLNVSTSGANANSTQTTYGAQFANSHSGTSSTNIAAYFTASGATNNYAIIVPSTGGNSGFGTTTPTNLSGTGSYFGNSQVNPVWVSANDPSKVTALVVQGNLGQAVQFIDQSGTAKADFGYYSSEIYIVNRAGGGTRFYNNSTNVAMFLDSNANLGIGTSNSAPASRLEVKGASGQLSTLIGDAGYGTGYAGISVNGTFASNSYSILGDASNLMINRPSGGDMYFREGNSTQMILKTSTGNLGIGTTGPDRKLDVLDASNPQLRLTYTDGSVYTDLQTNSSGDLKFRSTGDDYYVLDNSLAEGAKFSLSDSGNNEALFDLQVYRAGVYSSRFKVNQFGQVSMGTSGTDNGIDNVGIGIDADAKLEIGGNFSSSAWGLNGIQLQASAGTYTDSSTTTSGTATNAVFNSFAVPTLAATNATVTTTNAATLYVAGAPTAGTNQTITNAYPLWVDAGTSRFDGAVVIGDTSASAQLQVSTASNGTVGVFINGTSGQTANLLNIGKGGNPGYFQIDSTGNIVTIGGVSATISASAGYAYFPAGKIITNGLQSSAGFNFITDSNTIGVAYTTNASADGVQIAHTFNSINTLVSGNKIVSFKNNGAEKAYIDYNGNLSVGSVTSTGALSVITTTSPQLTVGYDNSNKYTTAVSSAGAVTFDAVGASAGFVFSDAISSPGAGSNSERFGAGSTAAGVASVAIGKGASAQYAGSISIGYNATQTNTVADNYGIAIGYSASSDYTAVALGGIAVSSGNQNVAVGYDAQANGPYQSTALGGGARANATWGAATAVGWAADAVGSASVALGSSSTGAGYSVVIGMAASAGNSSSNLFNIAIGQSATISSSYSGSIVMGAQSAATGNAQFIAGSSNYPINDIYFGKGATNATATAYTINGTGGSGTDIAGADLIFAGGKGTGNSAGGDILFKTSDAGASGTTLQSLTTKMILTELGRLGVGVSVPTHNLDVATGISIRNGNPSATYTSNQIVMSYAGSDSYRHAINTRHDSASQAGNAIDFLLWNYGTDSAGTTGTKRVMTLQGDGNVGINITTPTARLQSNSSGGVAPLLLRYDSGGGYFDLLKATYNGGGYSEISSTQPIQVSATGSMVLSTSSGYVRVQDGTSGGSIRLVTAGNVETLQMTSAGVIQTLNSSNLTIGTNSTTAITIDTSQRVGIGDTSPAALLTVGSGDLFQVASNGDLTSSNAGTWTFSNDTNFALSGGVNGLAFDTNTLSIDASNNRIGLGTTSPSYQLDIRGGVENNAIYADTSSAQTALNIVGGDTNGYYPTLSLCPLANCNVGGGSIQGYDGISIVTRGYIRMMNESAYTNTVKDFLSIEHQTTGTPANGLGSAVLFRLESSTTANLDSGRISNYWTDVTHATRTSNLGFSTVNSGGSLTEKMTLQGNGNFGIGTTGPSAMLHVVKSDNGTDEIAKFFANNLTQGIGINYNSILAIGSNTNQNISITPKGSGDIILTSGRTGVAYTPTSGTAALMVNGAAAIGSSTYLNATAPTNGLIVEGNVGIGTTSPDKALEINSATGNNLRLTYNDANGSATNYVDLLSTSAGALTIQPSGFIANIGGGTTQTALRFLEPSGTGTDYAAIQANANVTTSYTWTLPAADASGCIQSNGSGTLSIASCGGGTTWNSISNPTGTQSLTFDDGELNSWTVSSDTETFQTITANSLTTGKIISASSSSLSSGTLIDLAVSGTAAASNTQTVLNISTSGANATSTQTTYGAQFANTHTGTSSTNIAGYFTASGGLYNYPAVFNSNGIGAIPSASATDVGSVLLQNNTAATNGNQQASPPLVFVGKGFKTSGSASQINQLRMFNLPVQGNQSSPSFVMQSFEPVLQEWNNMFVINSAGSITKGTIPWTSLVVGSGNLSIAHGANATTFTYNSLTTQSAFGLSSTSLTSGNLLQLTGSGATMTTGGELIDLALGANTVGAGLAITSTGAYTGTGAADGLINIVANSLSTGYGSQYSFTGLSSGTGLLITGGTSMTTNGELIDLNMGAATAGNGINVRTTGVYTGTGLAVITANSATTGTIQATSATGLTTGRAHAITLGTALTTGGAYSVTGASYLHTGTETGSLVSLAFTDASSNSTGTPVTNGILISPTMNTTASVGGKYINGIYISPTNTACGTTGGSCTYTGLYQTTPAITQSTTNNYTIYGSFISGGNLIQDTAAGGFTWIGERIAMPGTTQTTGGVSATGVSIALGKTTSGTERGLYITPNETASSGGTLDGIKIESQLSPSGTTTETALVIGSGWDYGISSGSNYYQTAGTMYHSSSNTTQATTASALSLVYNNVNSGTGIYLTTSSLTTGSSMQIVGGSSMTTGGELLDLSMGAATAGNGINIATTGVYTGTGLSVITANSATTGTIQATSATGLTTGRAQAITLGSALTTGGAISVASAAYAHTGTETGSLVSLAFNESTTAAVTSTTNGILISPSIGVGSGAATRTINGISVAPTFSVCSAGTCAVRGVNIANVTDGTGFTGTALNIGTGWDTAISSGGNYVQSAGTFSLTSANTTQVTTASAAALNFNSLTSGTGLYSASSTLSSGKLVDLQVSGTAAASNTQTVLNIATSGANGTSTQTTYGAYISNTHTGTSSTNVAAYFTASGGSNNYAAIFNAGNVGIGTTAPGALLHIEGGTTQDQLRMGTSSNYYSIGRDTSNGVLYFNGTQSGFRGYNFSNAETFTVSGSSAATFTNTATQLIIQSTTSAQQAGIQLSNSGRSYIWYLENRAGLDSPNDRFAIFNNSGTEIMTLTSGGNTQLGTGVTSATTTVDLGGTGTSNAVCHTTQTGTDNEGLVDCTSAPAADFAEMYPMSQDAEVGDVVALGPEQVNTYETVGNVIDWSKVKGKISKLVKANTAYQANAIGIVSDNYGDFISTGYNIKPEDNPKSVALVGRVLVKVTTENGAIQAGDFLTSSSTIPGAAMRATKAGPIIGQALTSYSGSSTGKIMVFVKATNYDGVRIEKQIAGLNFNYSSVTSQKENSEQILAHLLSELPNLNTNNLSQVNTDVVVAGAEVVTPNVTSRSLATDIISAAQSGQGLTILSAAMFKGGLLVDSISSLTDLITFNSNVEFIGTPYFGSDTAGFADIMTGAQTVDITFGHEYLVQPIVNASISFEQPVDTTIITDPATIAALKQAQIDLAKTFLENGISYVVTNKSKTGFTIVLNKPAPQDIKFSWVALAVKSAVTFTGEPEVGTPIDFGAIAGSSTDSSTPTGTGTGDIPIGTQVGGDAGTPPPEPTPESAPTPAPDPQPTPPVADAAP